MKTPLGTEVDLGPGLIVLDGVPAPVKGAMSPISATAELLYQYIATRPSPHARILPITCERVVHFDE